MDYAQLTKTYMDEGVQRRYSAARQTSAVPHRVMGSPDLSQTSTAHIERQNLTLRMFQRRYTRLTNAFSKKYENHVRALALHVVYYNWCYVHKTIQCTPAMAAGLATEPKDTEWIVGLIPK